MKPPNPFARAIDALNSEGVFTPNSITANRLMELQDGSKAILPVKPYWVELRDGAFMIKQTLLLASLDPAERFKRDAVSRVLKARDLTNLIPPDATYRKAQGEFVRTLRDLVGKWHESNWNLAACFQKHAEMRRRIEGFLRRQPLALMPASSGPSILAGPFGAFPLRRYPRGKDKPVMRARHEAMALFIDLVRHSGFVRMGKCMRCGRYFYGRPGQKCCPRPRRCGSYRAAIEATKLRWNRERREKLQRAQDTCAEWERRRPKADWKSWAAARIGVTRKWLTRAVNSKELKPPRADEGRKP